MRFSLVAAIAAAVSIVFSSFRTAEAAAPLFGFQTGPNSTPISAAGIHYDMKSNLIYMTGENFQKSGSVITPQSECYVMSYDLSSLTMKREKIFGNADTVDFCSAITLTPNELIVTGNSAPGGWSADFLGGDGNAKLHGLVAVLDKNRLVPAGSITGMTMLTNDVSNNIPYPKDVVADSWGNIWVVAVTTTDSIENLDYDDDDGISASTWMGEHLTYGISTYMSIFKYKEVGGTKFELDFTSEFPMDPAKNEGAAPKVNIGGLILKNNDPDAINIDDTANPAPSHDHHFLIVAGSTRGESEGYGEGVGTDEDGFIALVDHETGKLLDIDSAAASKGSISHNNARVGTAADDIVSGICNDYSDPDSFFIVGATRGNFDNPDQTQIEPGGVEGSMQGFIMKMSIEDLDYEWVKQFSASPVLEVDPSIASIAYALSCVVREDTVYVAGNVENGNAMFNQKDSELLDTQGLDDVWIASLKTDNGDIQWMIQTGTEGDDTLAKHNGLVITDEYLLVFGETDGDYFRTRMKENAANTDLFLLSINPLTGETGVDDDDDDDDDDDYPVAADDDDTDMGGNDEDIKDDEIPDLVEDNDQDEGMVDDDDDTDMDGNDKDEGMVEDDDDDTDMGGNDEDIKEDETLGLVDDNGSGTIQEESHFLKYLLFVGFVLLIIACGLYTHNNKKRALSKKRSIFPYLQNFDVEDIDLRKSPPGGWHGTYLNELAYGINTAGASFNDYGNYDGSEAFDEDILEGKPLAHSSFVSDSLFVDKASTPSLGYRDYDDMPAKYRDGSEGRLGTVII
jgi:hypothetical protein